MPEARPFRFGVLAERVETRDDLIDIAQRVEQLNFSILLMRDHLIEYPFGHQLAPLTALATVAAATVTLRLGTLVISNDYRPTIQLAKEFLTLDLLSAGRAECGIGAGFLRQEYILQGIPFDPPAVRVERLEESVHILRGLFAGEAVSFHGDHYVVDGFREFPAPVQSPRVPLLVAGRGKRMLSIAARHADIIGLQTVSTVGGDMQDDPQTRLAGTVAWMVDVIRSAAGARFSELELNTTISLIITDDRVGSAERLIQERGWQGVTAEQVLEMPALFLGTYDEITRQMQDRRERYGLSYFVVSAANVEVAAPLVARLAGA